MARKNRITLSEGEREQLEAISHSKTAGRRQVERAQTLLLAHLGESSNTIAKKLSRERKTIQRRIKLFNEIGMESLCDQPRTGRPPTYSEEERRIIASAARANPQLAGTPYKHWTLNRLVNHINHELEISISRAHLARVLEAEGLRWYLEKTE